MAEVENANPRNRVLGGFLAILNIIVVLVAIGLGRAYPLPVCILSAIYFSVLLGTAISKYNAAKEAGEDTSEHKKSIGGYVAWIVFVAAGLGFQVWSVGGFQPNSVSSSYQTPAELAAQAAQEAKSSTTLPYDLDDVTRFTDITSSDNNIQYHYTIHDADTSSVTGETLYNSVQPSVCANTSTKNLLERGIDLEYIYTINENGGGYSFIITNSDC